MKPGGSAKKIKTSRIVLWLVLVVIVGAGVAGMRRNSTNLPEPSGETNTAGDIIEFTVVGVSMAPLLQDGQKIRVHTGAYRADPATHGDVVLIEQPGDNGHLVKFVQAIPGDRLELSEQPGGSHILVNGEILVNSEGEPYLLPEHKAAMIGLYIRDYAGVIPDGAYLVLGNLVRGSTDSTIFGLVDAGRIKGKVLTE